MSTVVGTQYVMEMGQPVYRAWPASFFRLPIKSLGMQTAYRRASMAFRLRSDYIVCCSIMTFMTGSSLAVADYPGVRHRAQPALVGSGGSWMIQREHTYNFRNKTEVIKPILLYSL